MVYRLTKRKGRKVQISYKTDDGWTSWVSTGCDTIAEAELKIKNDKPTFGEYAKDFYDRTDTDSYLYRKRVRNKSVVENTLYQKKLILKKYLIPQFGETRIDQIKASIIETWFVKGKGVKCKHITGARSNVILSTLREILQFAVMDGLVDTNEARKVEIMDSTHKGRRPISQEEMLALFPNDDNKLIEIWGMPYATYFLIFIDTGFRPCEILALRYEDIKDGSIYTESMYDSYTKEIHHRIKTSKKGKKYKVGTISERTQRFIGKGNGLIFDTTTVNTKSAWRKFKLTAKAIIGRTDVTQYQLRSAFMTNRIGKYPKELVMELMGHTKFESCYDVRTPEQIVDNLKTALSRYQA